MIKKRKTIIIAIVSVMMVYAMLLVSTLGFIRDFHRCVRGDTENIDSRNRLLRYSIPGSIEYDYVESTVIPIFAIYGFKEGVIIVRYSKAAYRNGITVHGAWHITSKWKVKKIDGEWMVVEIEEDP